MEVATFHWADYAVFACLLLLSTGIGVYFGFKDRKKQSTEEFLMAGRSMSIGPVAGSMFATLMSSIAFLGDPVEVGLSLILLPEIAAIWLSATFP
jgi:Na+/proline symporter